MKKVDDVSKANAIQKIAHDTPEHQPQREPNEFDEGAHGRGRPNAGADGCAHGCAVKSSNRGPDVVSVRISERIADRRGALFASPPLRPGRAHGGAVLPRFLPPCEDQE